jgi:hypothetical protein
VQLGLYAHKRLLGIPGVLAEGAARVVEQWE